MSNFKTEEFFDYLNIKLSDLFENNCFSVNKRFDYFRLHKFNYNFALTEKYKAYQNALNRILKLVKQNNYHCILN